MAAIANLQHASTFSHNFSRPVCTAASPASKLQSLCLSPPKPGWPWWRANSTYLDTNKIRLSSLGGNGHDYRNCSYEQRDSAKELYGSIAGNRWIQLVCGVIAMIVISNYQYAFTLFTPGMRQTFTGVPYAKIAAVFSAFILFETWPMPVAGYFVDKFGIRKLMTVGSRDAQQSVGAKASAASSRLTRRRGRRKMGAGRQK